MIELLAFLVALLLIAVISEPLVERLKIPFSAFLVVLGFGAGELFTTFGGDTGLHWQLFHDLIFFVFLPVLIFEAAFNIDIRQLLRNLPLILLLVLRHRPPQRLPVDRRADRRRAAVCHRPGRGARTFQARRRPRAAAHHHRRGKPVQRRHRGRAVHAALGPGHR